MIETNKTKDSWLNSVIYDLYRKLHQNSVKSVKKFLPTQFVAWSGTPRIHHYFQVWAPLPPTQQINKIHLRVSEPNSLHNQFYINRVPRSEGIVINLFCIHLFGRLVMHRRLENKMSCWKWLKMCISKNKEKWFKCVPDFTNIWACIGHFLSSEWFVHAHFSLS